MVAIVLILISCGSLKEQTSYKNPDTVLFHADKVLVVGMVSDYGTRMRFESRLKDALTERGVEAMRSVDLFDVEFTAYERSEAELDKVEQQLLDKDFDAILFSKRIGSKTRSQLSAQLKEMGESYERFQEDYLIHQGIYYDQQASENKGQYIAETSLYCICDGKQRELIWRSDVRLPNKRNTDRVFDSYADWLVQNLEVQQLIIGHKPF
jgi:translation elongation factor P/translation initiation factor 5A